MFGSISENIWFGKFDINFNKAMLVHFSNQSILNGLITNQNNIFIGNVGF